MSAVPFGRTYCCFWLCIMYSFVIRVALILCRGGSAQASLIGDRIPMAGSYRRVLLLAVPRVAREKVRAGFRVGAF